MRKILIIILIGILSMGLFSFLKKEKKTESNTDSVILGMVLLEDPNSFNLKGAVNELKTKWKLEVDIKEADDDVTILEIGAYNIAVAVIPLAIPEREVESAAEYNYFWENGVEETSKHQGHIILSIVNAGKNPVQENVLYCKLASSVMNNSKSIGIYIGGRTLVLKKDFYQSNVDIMTKEDLPLYNWIYFGLRKENGKQSVYTYGLADFGKKEMEIVNSQHSLDELSQMMYNITHYVLAQNVLLKDGETIGFTIEQKLKISESEGRFLDGMTLKIDY